MRKETHVKCCDDGVAHRLALLERNMSNECLGIFAVECATNLSWNIGGSELPGEERPGEEGGRGSGYVVLASSQAQLQSRHGWFTYPGQRKARRKRQ